MRSTSGRTREAARSQRRKFLRRTLADQPAVWKTPPEIAREWRVEPVKITSLSGLAASLDVRLQEAKSNRLDHVEFLELILQDELAVRQERLINRRTTAAAFP